MLERSEDLDGVQDELERWAEVGGGRASVFLMRELEDLFGKKKEKRERSESVEEGGKKQVAHQDN